MKRRIEAVIHMTSFYFKVAESVARPEVFFVTTSPEAPKYSQRWSKQNVRSSSFHRRDRSMAVPINRLWREMANGADKCVCCSKLIVEQMIGWTAIAHGLTAAALRYLDAAGATVMNGEDHQHESHLSSASYLHAASTNRSLKLFRRITRHAMGPVFAITSM